MLGHLLQVNDLDMIPPTTDPQESSHYGLDPECDYQICSSCRPGAADRSFLSLNAVAQGEMLPTAAAGFGFQAIGERPVIDAEVLRNIGNRPNPAVSRPRTLRKCRSN